MTYFSIQEIKDKNKEIGHFWFKRSTMAFFKTKIVSPVLHGCYFITRETNPSGVTKFSIRKANERGEISTLGQFHSYDTKRQATDSLLTLIINQE